MDRALCVGPYALLRNAIGWPYCNKTAPMPLSQASVSTVKGRVKLGKASTGVVLMAIFRLPKAYWAVVDH